ncbi:hypothetical protein TNCV_750441 [Trichonephila clavipes]|nr:hypothetical protein TNCV_750441 [Trichonephila clavipes]
MVMVDTGVRIARLMVDNDELSAVTADLIVNMSSRSALLVKAALKRAGGTDAGMANGNAGVQKLVKLLESERLLGVRSCLCVGVALSLLVVLKA